MTTMQFVSYNFFMSKILIKKCNLVSLDPKREKLERNIDLLIADGKIADIGYDLVCNDAEVIDGYKRCVIPGLINCHNHIPMSLFREIVDGYKLQE
jgi:5-methylthioadenosine/S-adenosylhomocysteine deaminase